MATLKVTYLRAVGIDSTVIITPEAFPVACRTIMKHGLMIGISTLITPGAILEVEELTAGGRKKGQTQPEIQNIPLKKRGMKDI